MNDRKLLELGAKAAGLKVFWGHAGSCQYKTDKLYRELTGRTMYTAPEWNPLTDDGDAFRLAAALQLTVDFERGVVWGVGDLDETCLARVSKEQPCMRRAIVLAAAEIRRLKQWAR